MEKIQIIQTHNSCLINHDLFFTLREVGFNVLLKYSFKHDQTSVEAISDLDEEYSRYGYSAIYEHAGKIFHIPCYATNYGVYSLSQKTFCHSARILSTCKDSFDNSVVYKDRVFCVPLDVHGAIIVYDLTKENEVKAISFPSSIKREGAYIRRVFRKSPKEFGLLISPINNVIYVDMEDDTITFEKNVFENKTIDAVFAYQDKLLYRCLNDNGVYVVDSDGKNRCVCRIPTIGRVEFIGVWYNHIFLDSVFESMKYLISIEDLEKDNIEFQVFDESKYVRSGVNNTYGHITKDDNGNQYYFSGCSESLFYYLNGHLVRKNLMLSSDEESKIDAAWRNVLYKKRLMHERKSFDLERMLFAL